MEVARSIRAWVFSFSWRASPDWNFAMTDQPAPSEAVVFKDGGFFYVEWVGEPCPFCGKPGVSGKHPEGPVFAGCPDPDCLAHNLAYDFVTVDYAREAWNTRALPSFAEGVEASARVVREWPEDINYTDELVDAILALAPSPAPPAKEPNATAILSELTREEGDELLEFIRYLRANKQLPPSAMAGREEMVALLREALDKIWSFTLNYGPADVATIVNQVARDALDAADATLKDGQ
jgi:hypothetical protein